jgi:signal peptidase I
MLNRKVNPLITISFVGLICAAAFWYVKAPPTQFVTVRGISMAPTLGDGQQILILADYLAKYQKGDIVVFERREPAGDTPVVSGNPAENSTYRDYVYVKRIVGMPGETISVVRGKIWLGGLYPIDQYFYGEVSGYMAPLTLGADQYFMVGDNVNLSLDSRFPSIGPVSRRQFIGKMIKAF